MELENEVNLEKNIEIKEANLDNQKSFLETTIGKVVNTRVRRWTKNGLTRFNRRSNYSSKGCDYKPRI